MTGADRNSRLWTARGLWSGEPTTNAPRNILWQRGRAKCKGSNITSKSSRARGATRSSRIKARPRSASIADQDSDWSRNTCTRPVDCLKRFRRAWEQRRCGRLLATRWPRSRGSHLVAVSRVAATLFRPTKARQRGTGRGWEPKARRLGVRLGYGASHDEDPTIWPKPTEPSSGRSGLSTAGPRHNFLPQHLSLSTQAEVGMGLRGVRREGWAARLDSEGDKESASPLALFEQWAFG